MWSAKRVTNLRAVLFWPTASCRNSYRHLVPMNVWFSTTLSNCLLTCTSLRMKCLYRYTCKNCSWIFTPIFWSHIWRRLLHFTRLFQYEPQQAILPLTNRAMGRAISVRQSMQLLLVIQHCRQRPLPKPFVGKYFLVKPWWCYDIGWVMD